MQTTKQKLGLQIIAFMFIIGGLVRLVADKETFKLFGIEKLWLDNNYHIYIYKVLGAFVVFMGLLMFSVAKNIHQNLNVLNTIKFGLIFIGATMLITGYVVKLSFVYYAPDFIFCFLVALYIHQIKNQLK